MSGVVVLCCLPFALFNYLSNLYYCPFAFALPPEVSARIIICLWYIHTAIMTGTELSRKTHTIVNPRLCGSPALKSLKFVNC